MAKKLDGKIALVTGGTTGIGLATAKLFAAEGAYVFVTGRRQAELDAAVKSIGNATGFKVDSANMNDLDKLYSQVKELKGRIDVLFVNAGGGSMLPLDSVTEAHFDDTFDRNVKGVLFTVQKALSLLSNNSSVILTSSSTGNRGTANFSVYAASKAAIRSFARNWILDLKGRGIRVNTISPGPTMTPGLVDLAGPGAAAQRVLLDQLATSVPIGRVGTADEIAKGVLYLASDDSSFVNGIELAVDGGQAQI